MKKYWLAILQGAVSAFLIWRLVGDSFLHSEVSKVLSQADPRWLLAAFAAALAAELLSAVRWWFVLRAFGTPVSLGKVMVFWGAGLFFSLGLPGTGGGDAFRIIYMIRLYPRRKLRASLSILADRLSGLVALIVSLGLAGILRHRQFASDPLAYRIFTAASGLLALAVLLMLLWWATTIPSIRSRWKSGMFPAFRKRVHHLGVMFSGLGQRPRLIGVALGIALAAFLSHSMTYFFSARSFGLPMSAGDMLSVMPAVDTLIVLPITLFGIGLRETLFQHLLGGIYGIKPAAAALASMGGFCIQVAVSLLGGLLIPLTTSNGKKRAIDNA
jgi:uncharacterized membrane protein YbhN (UPF0104 family)